MNTHRGWVITSFHRPQHPSTPGTGQSPQVLMNKRPPRHQVHLHNWRCCPSKTWRHPIGQFRVSRIDSVTQPFQRNNKTILTLSLSLVPINSRLPPFPLSISSRNCCRSFTHSRLFPKLRNAPSSLKSLPLDFFLPVSPWSDSVAFFFFKKMRWLRRWTVHSYRVLAVTAARRSSRSYHVTPRSSSPGTTAPSLSSWD